MMLNSTVSKSSEATSGRSWKRAGGFVSGIALALAGLVLCASAAASYALRAGGAWPAEPVFAAAIRGGAGCGLVLIGFTVMVLCTRGVEAAHISAVDHRTQLVAAIAADDLLCDRCGAANDHLARFCDQCGRRL